MAVFTPAFMRATSGLGVPLAGAKCWFYQHNTLTPVTVYEDAGLTTPTTNPVVADANGLFPDVYWNNGTRTRAIYTTNAGDPTVSGDRLLDVEDIGSTAVTAGMATNGSNVSMSDAEAESFREAIKAQTTMVFGTITDAEAAEIDADWESILVEKHAGNRPTSLAVYSEVTDSGTLEAWQFRSNGNSRRWQLAAGVVSPETFGAVADGSTDDTAAIQAAIDFTEAMGGGTIRFTSGLTYAATSAVTVSGAKVRIEGYGATLLNGRITATDTATDFALVGLRLLNDETDGASYHFEISATRFLVEDVFCEKDPVAGGYQGYFRVDSSYGVIRGLRSRGSNGFFVGGHDHSFVNFDLESNMAGGPGGDDGFAIHAPNSQTYNIAIGPGVVRGHQNIASLGSAVGSSTDPGDYSHYVRNVAITGVVAYNCVGLVFIKPGAITSTPYYNGLVESVQITGCTLWDPAGHLYSQAIQIWAGRGSIVRNIGISDCRVVARAKSNGVTNVGVAIITRPDGDPATIENITLDGVSITDAHGGADNSGGAPGYPIDWGVFIEDQHGSGIIDGIVFDGIELDGNKTGGAYVDASVSGSVEFIAPKMRNTAVNPPGSTGGGIFSPKSGIIIHDADIEVDNLKPVGGALLTSTEYRSESVTLTAGSAPAGTGVANPFWIAPFDLYVWKVELIDAAGIAVDGTNYVSILIVNEATGTAITGINTSSTGLTAGVAKATETSTIVASQAYVAKGTVIRFGKTDFGSGKAITNMSVTIHYVPYSR